MQCMQPPFYKESNPPPLFSSLFLIPPLWTSFSYPPSSARSSLALPQFASEKYPEGKDIHVNVSLSSLFVFVVLGRFLLNADSFLPLGCTVDWPWWQRLGFDLQRLNGVGLASAAVDGSGSSSHTKNT